MTNNVHHESLSCLADLPSEVQALGDQGGTIEDTLALVVTEWYAALRASVADRAL